MKVKSYILFYLVLYILFYGSFAQTFKTYKEFQTFLNQENDDSVKYFTAQTMGLDIQESFMDSSIFYFNLMEKIAKNGKGRNISSMQKSEKDGYIT